MGFVSPVTDRQRRRSVSLWDEVRSFNPLALGEDCDLPMVGRGQSITQAALLPPVFWSLPTYLRRVLDFRTRCRAKLGAGFTLIELLLVLAIVGTLAAVAVPVLAQAFDKEKTARAIGDISALQTDLMAYELSEGAPPETLADMGWGGGDLLDPWGNPYQYQAFVTTVMQNDKREVEPRQGVTPRSDRFLKPLNSSFDLYSMGKDGETKPKLGAKVSVDDIIRANDGHYIGLASQY